MVPSASTFSTDPLCDIHHFIAHPVNYGFIMGNKKHGKIQILLKLKYQRKNLALYGDIQRRDRLISYDESCSGNKRQSYVHPLFLTTREFSGVSVRKLFRQFYSF